MKRPRIFTVCVVCMFCILSYSPPECSAAERCASAAPGSRSGAEAGGCRLPGRAGGYPPGPPTDPDVRHARIRFLSMASASPQRWRRATAALAPSPGLPGAGGVRSRSLPCLQPAGALPGGRLPARGSLGPPCPTCTGTLRRSACPRPLSGGFPWRSPPRYLACFRPSWGPSRARDPADAPGHARAWGHPLPQAGPGGQGDRGLSHVPACPRGLPAHLRQAKTCRLRKPLIDIS